MLLGARQLHIVPQLHDAQAALDGISTGRQGSACPSAQSSLSNCRAACRAWRCWQPQGQPFTHSGRRCSHWRDCHFDDALSPSLLKHVRKVEGGCSRMAVSPTATPMMSRIADALQMNRVTVLQVLRAGLRAPSAVDMCCSCGPPSVSLAPLCSVFVRRYSLLYSTAQVPRPLWHKDPLGAALYLPYIFLKILCVPGLQRENVLEHQNEPPTTACARKVA